MKALSDQRLYPVNDVLKNNLHKIKVRHLEKKAKVNVKKRPSKFKKIL